MWAAVLLLSSWQSWVFWYSGFHTTLLWWDCDVCSCSCWQRGKAFLQIRYNLLFTCKVLRCPPLLNKPEFVHPVAYCCVLLGVAWSFKLVKLLRQHFFCSVIAEAQHSAIMLDLFAYSSYDEVFWFVSLPQYTACPSIVESNIACVCTSLPTPFAKPTSPNNVGSCCVHLHRAYCLFFFSFSLYM